jgi:hypothetical protein
MKATLTSLLTLLLLSTLAYAQPQVSYMIPDIGTPGMNTYVELVAPNNATGTFGGNGLFVNDGSETVSVLPATAADSANVVVGPLVVSWDGRLISTQIFVKPTATVGAAVALRVTVNAQSRVVNEFTIVAPQVLGAGGTLSTGGALGSGGALGTRSKRGAMIVSSLFLASGNYTVSTSDPDPSTPGNQGYLPFILISKGPFGINFGVTLNANSTGANGGPGGGGGGGNFCDQAVTDGGPGSDGGAGYTGGGAGGHNPNPYKNVGAGSGNGGASLNNTAPGEYDNCGSYEGAGGGTGHPFGRSGGGYCSDNSQGFYGGGSTGGNNSTPTAAGAGGGYGTNGLAGVGIGTAQSFGKLHGNPEGVPVAGGSGGGSGNPRGIFGSCGGIGGGGGGALVLFSMDVLNNSKVEAKGGNGGAQSGSTTNSGGGAGSGGFIELGAKILTSGGGGGDVSGGAGGSTGGGAGGNGRARYDGFVGTFPNFVGAAGTYVGPTIDTLSYNQGRTFTLRGSFNGTDQVRVFMRGETGIWQQIGFATPAGRIWTLPVTITGPRGIYYFCALQDVTGSNPGGYASRPDFVFSQAAANMVLVDLIPKISVDRTTLTFRDILCEISMLDSVTVYNTGDDTLAVNPSVTPSAFTIVSPAGSFKVPPLDSARVLLRFTPTAAGATSGTLTLANNDPRAGKNPTVITLQARKGNVQPELSASSINFGPVCRDSLSAPLTVTFSNKGDVAVTIDSIVRLGSGPARFTVTGPLPATLPLTVAAGGTRAITLTFRPDAAGPQADSFRVYVGPCNTQLVFSTRGLGVVNVLEVTPDPLDFGDVKVGTTATTPPLTIRNGGNADGTILDATITPAGSPFTLPAGLKGSAIAAGASINANVSFTPTATGVASATLCVVFNAACPDTVCIDLRGRGVTSLLRLSRDSVSLAADPCAAGGGTLTDTFKLYNRGLASVGINDVTPLNGLATVVPVPALPHDLAAGDSILFTVSWTPGVSGSERIRIRTAATDPQQQELFVGVGLLRDSSRVELSSITGGPLPAVLELGDVFNCTGAQTRSLLLRNGGTLTESVSVSFVNGGAFSFTPATSPFTISPGGTQGVTIAFNPATAGDYSDTLVVKGSHCGIEFRLPVTGHRYGVSFAVTGVDFGNSNVGVTRTGTATVINTSSTPNNVKLNIAGAYITQGGSTFAIVNPTGLPKSLAPGEAATVDITFTPTAQTSYNGQICFYTDFPCADTLCAPLSGTGIQSNLLVRQTSLNFGTLYICDDSTATLRLENTGTAPLQLQGLAIVGADAAAFEEATGLTLPTQISPGGTLDLKIRFVPARAGSDGLKSGTLQIRTDDAAQPLVTVALLGERRRQSLSTPTLIDFGRVLAGTSVEDTLTLENRTAVPMNIVSLSIPAPFTVLSPSAPLTVAPFDSIRIRIGFTPVDTTTITADLIVAESTPCVDTARIPVTGRGQVIRIGKAAVAISDSLHGAPGDHIAIPILLRDAELITESEATTFVAAVRFRASMLYPTGVRAKGEPFRKTEKVATGTITSSTISGSDRVVTVQLTNSPMPATAPDTLGYLDALVLLGDTTVTPITFDTLYWTDGDVQTSTSNGLFTLEGYCTTGGPRLVADGGRFGLKLAAPNPFNPETSLLFETVEDGITTLEIQDLYGNVVETLIDRRMMAPGAYTQIWNARNFASGVYYAVLTSPTQRSVLRVMLIK